MEILIAFYIISLLLFGKNFYTAFKADFGSFDNKSTRIIAAVAMALMLSPLGYFIVSASFISDYIKNKNNMRPKSALAMTMVSKLEKKLLNKEDLYIIIEGETIKLPESMRKELGLLLNEQRNNFSHSMRNPWNSSF